MNKTFIAKNTLLGFLFGLIFPLITLIVDILGRGMAITVANMFMLHDQNSIYYVVDLAPIVLGIFTFFVARHIEVLKLQEKEKIEIERDKSRKYGDYIEMMINGNYDFEIELGDLREDDELEDSLKTLRNNLIENEEREKIQNWATGGLAKFIEVLRSDSDNLSELGDRIISTLVKYIEANQGAIFVKEGEGKETVLKLLSAYAYDKKKFLNVEIKPGVGLTGTAFSDKNTIYVTEIPEDYVMISSGLGEARPRSVLVVPLQINEKVYGVVELASFHEFKDHEIEFVEKLAENIAATISGIKTSEITKKLLEESQLQTEQLKSQEEEMRQNMEELTATQEGIERKEHEYQRVINELEKQVRDFESKNKRP